MKIKNLSKMDQVIIIDSEKAKGISLKPGDNNVTKEQYELFKKDKWFNWLLQADLIEVPAEGTKKVAEMIHDEEKKKTKKKTVVEVEKK